jgi:hypothetical protein
MSAQAHQAFQAEIISLQTIYSPPGRFLFEDSAFTVQSVLLDSGCAAQICTDTAGSPIDVHLSHRGASRAC